MSALTDTANMACADSSRPTVVYEMWCSEYHVLPRAVGKPDHIAMLATNMEHAAALEAAKKFFLEQSSCALITVLVYQPYSKHKVRFFTMDANKL